MFAGILRELGVQDSSTSLIGADADVASLADSVTKAAKSVAPAVDVSFSHLMAAHATQLSDARARREMVERDHTATKSLIGWTLAAVLGGVVVYLLATRKSEWPSRA